MKNSTSRKFWFFFALGLLVLPTTVFAKRKNVVVSMYGSAMSKEGEGIFADDLYLKRCMAKSGWEVDTVVGGTKLTEPAKPGQPAVAGPDNFKMDVEQLAKEGHGKSSQVTAAELGLGDIGLDPSKPIDFKTLPPEKRVEISKRAAQVLAQHAARSAQGLEKGSNFMLDLYAHGSSNCAKHKGDLVHDLSGGKGAADKQPEEGCEHSFAINIPGLGDIGISTKDMVPELEKLKDDLKKSGVHFAVNLKSCYGGAAIKDFAGAGICAQAYATADTEAQACGGEDEPPGSNAEYSSAAFSTRSGYFCKGLPNADIVKDPKFQTGGMNESCVMGARDNAAKAIETDGAVFDKPPTLSQVQESLRRRDRTANQPVGTDGPYWLINNTGLMGMAAQNSTDQLYRRPQAGICQYKTADEYFRAFAKNISDISDRALNGCSLKKPIDGFFDINLVQKRAGLDKYFADLRAHTSLVEGQTAKTMALCKQCAGDFDKAFADFGKTMVANAKNEAAKANAAKYWASDMAKDGYCQMVLPGQASCPSKAWPKGKTYKEALKDSTVENKQRLAQYTRQVEADMRTTITPMERSLYDVLNHSPEYKACLEKNPKLKEAHDACGEFRMPVDR